jgi:hypothetical protein
MRTLLKVSALLFCILITLTALGYFFWYKPKMKPTNKSFIFSKGFATKSEKYFLKKMQLNASQLKIFCSKNQYNTQYCFMVDMSIPSGKQRFFVYNLKKDSIEMAGLVTHGSGSVTGRDELYFSNEPGSSCTSLGKYKIGNPYTGRFGLAYKLYGLEKTNSKAFERFVVLHAHSCVPSSEVYPLSICPSLGCPTVAPVFLQKLSRYIDVSAIPIVLEIYQ